jgi:hypothetical protein
LIRTLLVAAVSVSAAGLTGCTGPDNPKMAEVPAGKVPPPDTSEKAKEPPKTPTGAPYGASKKYQDSMPQ